MALRDDLSAALARIKALELELAQTRDELAALQSGATPQRPPQPQHTPGSALWHEPWILALGSAPTRLAYVDRMGSSRLRIVSAAGAPTERLLAERGHETANRLGRHLVVQLDTLELALIAWPDSDDIARLVLPAPLAVPPLQGADGVLCATRDGQLHRIDPQRWQLIESRPHNGSAELERLGFDRARGSLGSALPGPRGATKTLRKLGWTIDNVLMLDDGAVVSLSRRFGDDPHWALARVELDAATPRWLHEVGAGMVSQLTLVDGWVVGFAGSHRDSVVLDLTSGRRWMRLHGVWESARADVLDDTGKQVATLAL